MPRLGVEPDFEKLAEALLDASPETYVPRSLIDPSGSRFDPEAITGAFERFIVVGVAGSGKSALFADLAAQAARRFLADPAGNPCPILIRGAELSRPRRPGGDLITVNGRGGLSASDLQSALKSGKAALWLDGWDEIPRDAVENEALWQLIDSSRHIAISTRPPVHQRFDKWSQLELAPLGSEDIDRFVLQLAGDRRTASLFNNALAMRHDLLDLARSPLLLSMMWQVFSVRAEFPTDPTTAYSIVVQSYLDRWDAKRGSVNRLTAGERLEFLSHIARRMYEVNRPQIYHDEILSFILEINQSNLKREDILADIATVGLFSRGEDGRFSFSHKSLKMYLIAFGFRDEPAGLAKLLRQNDSGWRQLVQFVGALAHSVDDLVEAFLEFDWTTHAAFALSSGRVKDDAMSKRVADRVEAQLGSRFIQQAAQHWISKDEGERAAAIRKRKLIEIKQYNDLLQPGLSGQSRGRLFEDFVAAFFEGPFRIINRNVLTLHGEIDLTFELIAAGPFWSDLGGQVLVECKNEAKNAETSQVNHFMQKVNNVQNVRLAFFVARNRIGRSAVDAMRVQAANPVRPLIIALTGEQIRRELDFPFERESFFVQAISDAKLMRR